jgi:HNH endonuclease/NUMOD3 motif
MREITHEMVDLDWLFERAQPVPFSGCWLWVRSLNTSGYAQTRIGKKHRVVHRVAYELKHGPVPDGLELDHLCRVRCCINPDHVEPVTRKVNALRGIAGEVIAKRNRSAEMRKAAAERSHKRGQSVETRAKLTALKIGLKHSDKTRAKIQAKAIGRVISPDVRAKLSAALTGRVMTAEHRAKLSQAAFARAARERAQREVI